MIIRNWYLNSKYRHLYVLFKNTVWKGFALSVIAERIEMLGNSTSFIEDKTNLQVVSASGTDVSLSWKPINSFLSHSETKLFLVHFKELEPKTLEKTQVGRLTSMTLFSLVS